MSVIQLPAGAVPRSLDAGFLDHGGWQRGPLGGAATRVDRLGSRYKAAFTFPPFQSRDLGRIVVSRLIRAQRLGIRLELPLGDFAPGVPGTPVVNGGNQAGASLTVGGFIPHYAVREGQWFNHRRGDDRLLYNIAAPVVADGAGAAVLTFEPMLRLEPANGDALTFAKPEIQGLVIGDERRWAMALERVIAIEFEVEEFV